ncbi:hypothetical protein CK203_046538 [Vitis vinifera]|uniref:Uncharacterized protein n=1 Tax=Vitis vinifera TaxID=29760 RepID=A0A438ILW1_VITVI|nr:hypothetical protein CK203_046538 [Vitis vinifera]
MFVHIRGRWPALSKSGSSPDHCIELSPEGAAWLMDLDGNQFSEPTNVDQLKRHHWVHSRDLLYLLHFMRAWVLIIGYLSLVSSFLSPYHPSLHYVPCLKTTLRPWDRISSSTASMWTEVTCSRIDDSMLSDLRPILYFDAIQGHISVRMRFTDHEGVVAYPYLRDVCRDDDIFAILAMIP